MIYIFHDYSKSLTFPTQQQLHHPITIPLAPQGPSSACSSSTCGNFVAGKMAFIIANWHQPWNSLHGNRRLKSLFFPSCARSWRLQPYTCDQILFDTQSAICPPPSSSKPTLDKSPLRTLLQHTPQVLQISSRTDCRPTPWWLTPSVNVCVRFFWVSLNRLDVQNSNVTARKLTRLI